MLFATGLRRIAALFLRRQQHHVEDVGGLLKSFSTHLAPGGRVALADLDKEDGRFHPEQVEGVFHHGFERDELQRQLEVTGFENIEFFDAMEIEKEGRRYPLFLVIANRLQG